MLIPNEQLDKYKISRNHLDDELGMYQTYLIRTDYICNKIVEGVSTREDYAEELNYRNIARQEIDNLLS